MKRFVSMLLALSLLLCVAGCDKSGKKQSATDPSKPDFWNQVTEEPTTEPTQEAQLRYPRPEAVIPFEYTMTTQDVEDFYTQLEAWESYCTTATDSAKAKEMTDELDASFDWLEEQSNIAQLIYYTDVTDEEASERHLDCVDILSDLNNDYIEATRRVFNSDCPVKDALFEDWTQQELDMLMKYTEEIAALEKRNAEILVEYQNLEDMTSDAMVPLYTEQVSNNNRIAQIYGYENYYEYAFTNVYSRDYESSQLSAMREYAALYLPGIYEPFLENLMEDVGDLSFSQQLKFTVFETSGYDELDKDYVGIYLDRMPQSVREGMAKVFDEGRSYFSDNPDSREGAFTTQIGDTAYCFFSPDYAGTLTVIHEAGHFYAAEHTQMDGISYDLAEVHSQGNEWIFLSMMEEEMDDTLYQLIAGNKLYTDLAMILVCVVVDEFEQQIYAHPDPTSLTPSDCNRIMEQVCEKYGGVDFLSEYTADIQSYWRMVVVESPVYYISYAVSGLAAINLYTMYQTDPQQAVETYCQLLETDWTDMGFLEAMEQVGLPGPFDESVYQDLVALAE